MHAVRKAGLSVAFVSLPGTGLGYNLFVWFMAVSVFSRREMPNDNTY